MKSRILWISVLVITAACFSLGGAPQSQNKKGIVIRTAKPYDKVRTAVRGMGGEVTYEYENIDAIAVLVPEDKVTSLATIADVGALYKDVLVNAPSPIAAPGGRPEKGFTIVKLSAKGATGLSGDEIGQITRSGTTHDFNNVLTGADTLHKEGNRGQGVLVAVIDTGVANSTQVAALAGSVIGGETLVPSDPVPSATSTLNNPHGTQVSSVLSAHAGFIFSNDSPLVSSLLVHDPASVIPCPDRRFPSCVAGQSVVPMIGTAPEAKLYAIKIFDSKGTPAPKSRIIAAMDRTLTLRRNFNSGRPSVPLNTPCGSEDNPCRFDSLPIQVVNMSLGGPSTFVGRDLEDQLTVRMLEAGMTPVASGGNDGFAAMTVGSPGTGFGTLTVGAATLVAAERVLRDLELGLGFGVFFRPSSHQQTADFSSRGPTADGRIDPDLVANGVGNYVQSADGSIALVLGTSFSSPTGAGAAALLTAGLRPGSVTATQVRNALSETANPSLLGDGSGPIDQGNGFIDIVAALKRLKSGRVSDRISQSAAGSRVAGNIAPLGFVPIKFTDDKFSTRIRDLRPGQVAQFFVETRDDISRIAVKIRNVTPELPPERQNQLFGDDIFFKVADAPTSFFKNRVDAFVNSDNTFIVDDPQTGLVRVALQGDWTNAGKVSADLIVERTHTPLLPETADGTILEHDVIEIPVHVPPNKHNAIFELFWENDWSAYPTNDLDMILCPPHVSLSSACNFTGARLDSPERVVIENPTQGLWKVFVVGFTVHTGTDRFKLRATADGERLRATH